ncbi:CDP-alcohol phosphatidyltransferase family protein [Anaerocolumna sp. AGMB13025]|uniref:CDP-alcohol phosphatidyltransferase family protein n=1 Tax=Anaerocolumna sp. AGMB13025 TaxID=3039116 RepID=UPI003FA428C5
MWYVSSGLGARLDSIADLILCALILCSIFLWMGKVVLWFVCILAAVSALEETIIHITSDKLDLDRRSIFNR